MRLAVAPWPRCFRVESGWAFGDPPDKFRQPGVAAQCFYRVKVAGQLGLGQGGVDFVVADLMQQDGRAALAAFEFGDKMVQALLCEGRDRTFAQGADRIIHRG